MVACEPGPKSALVFGICGPPGVSPHRYWFGLLLCHWPTPLKYLPLLQSAAPETGPLRWVEGGGGKNLLWYDSLSSATLDLARPLFHRVEPVVSPPPPPRVARSVRCSPLSLSPSLCASEALLFCAFVASPSRLFFLPLCCRSRVSKIWQVVRSSWWYFYRTSGGKFLSGVLVVTVLLLGGGGGFFCGICSSAARRFFFFSLRFIWRWHLDSAGGFLLEKDITLSTGLLLLSVAGNDRAGFESTLDKNTRYGSRIVGYWSLHPLHGWELFLLAVDLWSS